MHSSNILDCSHLTSRNFGGGGGNRTRNAMCQNPVTMQDSEFSAEALTEILTEISGTDRQMLSQIVKSVGSLSNELKRAVLRLVG